MATPIPTNQCAFRLDEVAAATGGEIFGAPDTIVRGVSGDTRALGAGALFVALRGDARDGHAYLTEAVARGAAAALIACARRIRWIASRSAAPWARPAPRSSAPPWCAHCSGKPSPRRATSTILSAY